MSWSPFDLRYRDVIIGAALGFSLAISSASIAAYIHSARQRRARLAAEPEFSARPIELRSDEIVDGVSGLIGATLRSPGSIELQVDLDLQETRPYSGLTH